MTLPYEIVGFDYKPGPDEQCYVTECAAGCRRWWMEVYLDKRDATDPQSFICPDCTAKPVQLGLFSEATA